MQRLHKIQLSELKRIIGSEVKRSFNSLNETKKIWKEITVQLADMLAGEGMSSDDFAEDPTSGVVNMPDTEDFNEDIVMQFLVPYNIIAFQVEDESNEGVKMLTLKGPIQRAQAQGLELIPVPGRNWNEFISVFRANSKMSLDNLNDIGVDDVDDGYFDTRKLKLGSPLPPAARRGGKGW